MSAREKCMYILFIYQMLPTYFNTKCSKWNTNRWSIHGENFKQIPVVEICLWGGTKWPSLIVAWKKKKLTVVLNFCINYLQFYNFNWIWWNPWYATSCFSSQWSESKPSFGPCWVFLMCPVCRWIWPVVCDVWHQYWLVRLASLRISVGVTVVNWYHTLLK